MQKSPFESLVIIKPVPVLRLDTIPPITAANIAKLREMKTKVTQVHFKQPLILE